MADSGQESNAQCHRRRHSTPAIAILPSACCAAPARRCSGRRASSPRGTASTSASRRRHHLPPLLLGRPAAAAAGAARRLARPQRHRLGPRHRADVLRRSRASRSSATRDFRWCRSAMAASSSLPPRRCSASCWRPSCCTERLPAKRVTGALVIVAGLVVIGGEAITTIGAHGVAGDLLFVLAGDVLRHLRHVAAEVARAADARHGRHQRAVARHPADLWHRWSASTASSRWGSGRTCCRR